MHILTVLVVLFVVLPMAIYVLFLITRLFGPPLAWIWTLDDRIGISPDHKLFDHKVFGGIPTVDLVIPIGLLMLSLVGVTLINLFGY